MMSRSASVRSSICRPLLLVAAVAVVLIGIITVTPSEVTAQISGGGGSGTRRSGLVPIIKGKATNTGTGASAAGGGGGGGGSGTNNHNHNGNHNNNNGPRIEPIDITLLPQEPTDEPTSSPAPSPSPSSAPTFDPGPSHQPTVSPSDPPTSSPAPSPSPSSAPTFSPSAGPSSMPSVGPTISVAPSASPTSSPSSIPSDAPSNVPSDAPSLSAAPSHSPTDAPSEIPSDIPSMAPSKAPSTSIMPSDSPSMTPSVAPSIAPTEQPSESPSGVPSGSPTSSPTAESQKTKTALTNVFLPGLSSEMEEMDMAHFEMATLQFIKDTMPYAAMEEDGYSIDVLAVTVLTQEIVFPDDDDDNTGSNSTQRRHHRRLQHSPSESTWESALQVEFRTVGVLTDGRVPQDDGWDFTEIADHGFIENYDQYLWELGSMAETDFFAPLKTYSSGGQITSPEATPEDGEGKSPGKMVAALLLAFLAIGIAGFASYFAIRQHKQKKNRRKNRKSLADKLSVNGGEGHPLSPTKTMSGDNDEESATASRRFLAAFTTGGHAMIDIDEQSLESVGLTPRNRVSPRTPGFGEEGMPEENLDASPTNEDADDTDTFFGRSTFMKKWLTPRRSQSNFSNMTGYSTTAKTGLFDPPENENTLDHDAGEPQEKPNASEETFKSIAGRTRSEPIHGLTTKESDDDGRSQYTVPIMMFGNGTEIETPLASLAPSSNYMNEKDIDKTFTGNNSSAGGLKESYAFSEATGIVDKVSNKSQASHEDASAASSKSSRRSEAMESKIQAFDKNFGTDKNSKTEAEPQPAIEMTLGARSMSVDEEEGQDLISPPKYRYNMTTTNIKRPSSIGIKSTAPGTSLIHQTEAKPAGGFTLGARPMGMAGSLEENRDEEDQRSTLSSVVRRSGAYDVYAPPGPIGIVVDTSKEGPSVHSLKATSPMMGLITPGDLIVALDDIDTRSMSAAALTRLMAKKSRQRERKITLYSVDGY